MVFHTLPVAAVSSPSTMSGQIAAVAVIGSAGQFAVDE